MECVHGQAFVLHQALVVCYVLGRYEQAVSHGTASRIIFEVPFQAATVATYMLFEGLATVALYRENTMSNRKDRKLLQVARRHCRSLDRMSRTAPYFVLGKLYLLQAELSSLKRKQDSTTERLFLSAKAFLAQPNQSTLEAAVASERFGDYFVNRRGPTNSSQARMNFKQAQALYAKWGAHEKCKSLKQMLSRPH